MCTSRCAKHYACHKKFAFRGSLYVGFATKSLFPGLQSVVPATKFTLRGLLNRFAPTKLLRSVVSTTKSAFQGLPSVAPATKSAFRGSPSATVPIKFNVSKLAECYTYPEVCKGNIYPIYPKNIIHHTYVI